MRSADQSIVNLMVMLSVCNYYPKSSSDMTWKRRPRRGIIINHVTYSLKHL